MSKMRVFSYIRTLRVIITLFIWSVCVVTWMESMIVKTFSISLWRENTQRVKANILSSSRKYEFHVTSRQIDREKNSQRIISAPQLLLYNLRYSAESSCFVMRFTEGEQMCLLFVIGGAAAGDSRLARYYVWFYIFQLVCVANAKVIN